jgi:hypothetical protein
MILPTSFAANWYAINTRKQAQLQSATDAKNRKCIPHEFRINDKVLICRDIGNPYLGKLAILSGERKLSCSIVQPKNLDGHHVETLKGLKDCEPLHSFQKLMYLEPHLGQS